MNQLVMHLLVLIFIGLEMVMDHINFIKCLQKQRPKLQPPHPGSLK